VIKKVTTTTTTELIVNAVFAIAGTMLRNISKLPFLRRIHGLRQNNERTKNASTV